MVLVSRQLGTSYSEFITGKKMMKTFCLKIIIEKTDPAQFFWTPTIMFNLTDYFRSEGRN